MQREKPLALTDLVADVIKNEIMPQLTYEKLILLGLSSKHFYGLFGSVNWQNLITRDFDIPEEELKKIQPYTNYQQLYQRLRKLIATKNFTGPIRNFCLDKENHEKLLACLANHPALLDKLPTTEDAIWLSVALAADCAVVYEDIYTSKRWYINRWELALKMSNEKAMDWIMEDQPKPIRELLLLDVVRSPLELPIEADSVELYEKLIKMLTVAGYVHSDNSLELFYFAIRLNSIRCAKWLKEILSKTKAEINEREMLDAAIESKSKRMLEFVLGHPGQPDPRAIKFIGSANTRLLKQIFVSGNKELIQFTLMHLNQDIITDLDKHFCMLGVFKSGDIETVKLMVKNFPLFLEAQDTYEILHLAAKKGHAELIRYLITTKFTNYFENVDYFNNMADREHVNHMLSAAVEAGSFPLLHYLIDNIRLHTPRGEEIIKHLAGIKNDAGIDDQSDYDAYSTESDGECEDAFEVDKEINFAMISHLKTFVASLLDIPRTQKTCTGYGRI